ncbi:MAG TPA: YciI family protein [Bryobacteraceae bacterium]|nr:YciI family protein [Bryobacteraceae bacterium]
MPHYMLLLYDDPSKWGKLSPEEMQKAIEKYSAWRTKPGVVDSNRLADDPGKVIRVTGNQPRATDGPYSETKEVLGGYYTIEAANYEEAVKLALAHPHVEYGGTVEVRQTWGSMT